MSENADIPPDLMRIATELAQVSVLDRAERIARAILAERVRCRKIADAVAHAYADHPLAEQAAEQIAEDIGNP
jgi:hypothetical protein